MVIKHGKRGSSCGLQFLMEAGKIVALPFVSASINYIGNGIL